MIWAGECWYRAAAVATLWHRGDVFRALRKRKGLRLRDAKAWADLSPTTVNSLELTGEGQPESLRRLAMALGVTVEIVDAHVVGAGLSPHEVEEFLAWREWMRIARGDPARKPRSRSRHGR